MGRSRKAKGAGNIALFLHGKSVAVIKTYLLHSSEGENRNV